MGIGSSIKNGVRFVFKTVTSVAVGAAVILGKDGIKDLFSVAGTLLALRSNPEKLTTELKDEAQDVISRAKDDFFAKLRGQETEGRSSTHTSDRVKAFTNLGKKLSDVGLIKGAVAVAAYGTTGSLFDKLIPEASDSASQNNTR